MDSQQTSAVRRNVRYVMRNMTRSCLIDKLLPMALVCMNSDKESDECSILWLESVVGTKGMVSALRHAADALEAQVEQKCT